MSLVKIYGDFYSSNNVAGVLGSKVITFDNPQLSIIQGDPAFSSFDEMCLPFGELYCDFCHSKLKGNLCYSCGASYEKEPTLNG
jgi:hypothetical protein